VKPRPPRERFLAALDRRPLTGRVPHFELVFFLTMEAFGKVHPCHRHYAQWDQMEEKERRLHRADIADVLIQTAERFEHSAIVIPSPAFFWWNAAELFHLIDQIREKSGDRYALFVNSDGTYDVPGGDRMVEFSMRLADEPEKVKAEADAEVDKVLEFAAQIRAHGVDQKYTGPEDVTGKFRLLWDATFLYLGVEATDNSFFPQPERGMAGFMGDSIEFAFQPDNRLDPQAPYREYELYLPGGQPPYAASRRLPAPTEMITNWQATVNPTGEKGNCIYQAAIPWKDVGLEAEPTAGKTFSFALVLNDADEEEQLGGGRCRVKWFDGIDTAKSPEGFGDITLVEP
jgi:hypothetical protein